MKILYTIGCYVILLSSNLLMRGRLAFCLILMLSVVAPVLDLLFFKMLAEAFTNLEIIRDDADLYLFILKIVLLLIVANGLKYITKVQRLKYISKIIEIVGVKTNEAIGGSANWLRMVLLEFFNSATAIFHVVTICFCSIFLSPMLGFCLLAAVFVSIIIIHYFFRREVFNQKKLYYNKVANSRQRGELTVLSRVKATEQATVIVNFVFLIYFIVLLFFLVGSGSSSSSEEGLIFLFLVRFVATTQGLLLSSLMRLARGWAQVEPKMPFLLKES